MTIEQAEAFLRARDEQHRCPCRVCVVQDVAELCGRRAAAWKKAAKKYRRVLVEIGDDIVAWARGVL